MLVGVSVGGGCEGVIVEAGRSVAVRETEVSVEGDVHPKQIITNVNKIVNPNLCLHMVDLPSICR